MNNNPIIKPAGSSNNTLDYDFDRHRHNTELAQNLTKDYYRMRFSELAEKLAKAQTGQIIVVDEDKALWMDGFIEAYLDEDDAEAVFTPTYEPYGFTSEEYNTCAGRVEQALVLHRANSICEALRSERQKSIEKAAKLGYPQNIYFRFRDYPTGPSYHTIIVSDEGVSRLREFTIGDTEKPEYFEGWSQLMPNEIIATWAKMSMSEPHYFRLELYVEADELPEELTLIAEDVPDSRLVHLMLDSEMPELSEDALGCLLKFFNMPQLECLGEEQAQIRLTYEQAIEPIYGGTSPDVEGGWLGLLGIAQTYVIVPEKDESDKDEE